MSVYIYIYTDTAEYNSYIHIYTHYTMTCVYLCMQGFTGNWPQSRCDNTDSGLPKGSKVCNTMPRITVPPSPQRFVCNELNRFQVTASDGTGTDKSISNPKGVFAIRFRQRLSLARNYPIGECSDKSVGG